MTTTTPDPAGIDLDALGLLLANALSAPRMVDRVDAEGELRTALRKSAFNLIALAKRTEAAEVRVAELEEAVVKTIGTANWMLRRHLDHLMKDTIGLLADPLRLLFQRSNP